ncbi:MAG: hypothetical protein LBG30_07600 [Odoribacteraceae bacterium]|jgi:hypothetical protein|nr:hypothetical protein [Odoribacteraceae bacterium]
MKDQLALLRRCLRDDVPAVVISARDVCSVPVLRRYLEEAIARGCDEEFIEDFRAVLNGFVLFQEEEPGNVNIPDL